MVCVYRDALIHAANNGQIEAFEALLEHIPWDLHEIDRNYKGQWYGLSHFAAQHNQSVTIDFLVEDTRICHHLYTLPYMKDIWKF